MVIKPGLAAPAASGGTAAGPRHQWTVLVIILSAVFMQLLDTTITMVAVPSIQAGLRASYGEVQLVVALYLLAFACVLVTGGRLGDAYGRKKMFLCGMAGFTVASAVCGVAPDALTLIVSRVVQGMSSGLMFPQVLGIIQVIFSKAQRTRAITIYGATIGLATILGPVTGGALIALNLAGSGWRSIFYVNVPIGVAALALGAAKIPESRAQRAAGSTSPARCCSAPACSCSCFRWSSAATRTGLAGRSAAWRPARSCWPASSATSAAAPGGTPAR